MNIDEQMRRRRPSASGTAIRGRSGMARRSRDCNVGLAEDLALAESLKQMVAERRRQTAAVSSGHY